MRGMIIIRYIVYDQLEYPAIYLLNNTGTFPLHGAPVDWLIKSISFGIIP